MGIFNFLKSKKQNNSTSIFAFVSETTNEGVSLDEATKLRNDFLLMMNEDDKSKQFNAASKFMMMKAYDECINAYQLLMAKYPDSIGLCESQIGAAFYFKGDYDRAITHYIIARENGEDENMMDDNIWEACETKYKKTNDKSSISKYLSLCPQGKYVKKAEKI